MLMFILWCNTEKIKGFSSFCFFTPLFAVLYSPSASHTHINSRQTHTWKSTPTESAWGKIHDDIFLLCECVCSSCPKFFPLAYKHTQNRTVNQDLVSVWNDYFHVISIAVRCQCPDLRDRCVSQTNMWPMMLRPQALAHMDLHNDWWRSLMGWTSWELRKQALSRFTWRSLTKQVF